MEYTTLTFPHPVGRHDVLSHGSRSALADYTSPFFSHIAFRMAPGDMGSLVIRTPMAWEMALARAARGGMMGTSPTPRSPKGWRGLGTSTSTVSIMGVSRVVGMR